jgi:hypothetical protein
MDLSRKIAASPSLPRVVQDEPIAAQKTAWLAHLQLRLRGNFASKESFL